MSRQLVRALLTTALLATASDAADHGDPAWLEGTHTGDAALPVDHDFVLHCDPDLGQNRLQLAWQDAGGTAQTFELARVIDGFCEDDPTIAGPAGANFDTHEGEGEDTAGARVAWRVTASTEGQQQVAWHITDATGVELLDASGSIAADHDATGHAFLPVVPGVDAANVVHHVALDYYGRGIHFDATPLPAGATFEDALNPAPKTDAFVPGPIPKVSPDLAAAMASGSPTDLLDVVITLVDNGSVPRFPGLPRGVRPEDPEAAPYIAQRDAVVASLTAERTLATQDLLADAALADTTVDTQFWLIPAFVAQATIADLQVIEAQPELAYMALRDTKTLPIPPTHVDSFDHGTPALARARMGSDYYFNQSGSSAGEAGLIDSAVGITLTGTPIHTLLLPAGIRLNEQGDCAYSTGGSQTPDGGLTCLDSAAPDFDLLDCNDHGLASASLLTGNGNLGPDQRGISAVRMDSWKTDFFPKSLVPNVVCEGTMGIGVVAAFQAGLLQFNTIFAAVVQVPEPETGPTAAAADAAFDAGAVVVAANGNCAVDVGCEVREGTPSPMTVRSPAIAHKVLGIGDYNVVTLHTEDYNGQGPANDGRVKPDVQTPTDISAAANDNIFATKPIHGGTSGATPVATGAAVLTRGWLAKQGVFDPGHTYARMILSGQEVFANGYSNVDGAGHIRMPGCGTAIFAKIDVPKFLEASVVQIDLPVRSYHNDIKAAIWWPEGLYAHNDIDLYLRDPNGVEQASAHSEPSVWERLELANPAPGTWKLRVEGHTFAPGIFEQTVYVSVHMRGCQQITSTNDDLFDLLWPIQIPEDGPLWEWGPQLRATIEAAMQTRDTDAHSTIEALRHYGDTLETGLGLGLITLPEAPDLLFKARRMQQQLAQGQWPTPVPALSPLWLALLAAALGAIEVARRR